MIAARSLRVVIAVSLLVASLCPGAWASVWALDPSASRIAFSVRNLSVAHVDGTFRLASGRVTLDDEDPSRSTIEAVIDAASVDTSESKRDAHLRSADFLDVARYPTIAFRSTRIERGDSGHWKVTGDLTLLGRTRPVLLEVERSTSEGTRPSAHATTTIDRRDFGMTYAGFAVGKQVVITIDAVGINTAADASHDDRHGENSRQSDGDSRTTFTADDVTRPRDAESTALQNVADTDRLARPPRRRSASSRGPAWPR